MMVHWEIQLVDLGERGSLVVVNVVHWWGERGSLVVVNVVHWWGERHSRVNVVHW
jgi:hypothetical protein